MRILLIVSLILVLTGCKQKQKWDKDTLVNDCLHNFTKKNEERKIFTTMQLAHVCDCITEKMLVKYSSAKAADKDPEGSQQMQQMGRECTTEALQSKKWDGTPE